MKTPRFGSLSEMKNFHLLAPPTIVVKKQEVPSSKL